MRPVEEDANMSPVCEDHEGGSGPLFLLDGNNIAYRAYFALPQDIATSAGFPTNALYGFCLMIIKILTDYRPGSVIVAWDSREKTFRHAAYEAYKAQRKPMPEALVEQWPYFVEICSAFGFANLAVPGYEADDLLATLARQAEAEKRPTVVVTGDRDALQLAGEYVGVMVNTRGMSEVKVYDPAAVEERFGVRPELIPDFIGLKGDSSDNIPGVPGIGEKSAAELLGRYGSVEGVLEHISEISGVKRREVLAAGGEMALLSKGLATLDDRVPVTIQAAERLPRSPDGAKLAGLFAELEFDSLMERVRPLLEVPSAGPAPSGGDAFPRVVEASAGPSALSRLLRANASTGVSSSGVEGSPLWLAQVREGGDVADYGCYLLVRVDDAGGASGEVRRLVGASHLVCHDFKSLRSLHEHIGRAGHDTHVAAYLLSPGRRDYLLKDLARDAGIPLPRRAEDGGSGEAAIDAALVLRVAAEQERELRQKDMWELFRDMELPLTRVLIDMERAGMYLDRYRLSEITGKVQDQIEELETLIFELAGEEFNLGSPQQLGRILFDRIGLPRQRRTKTGYSTDAKTLEALRNRHPIVAHVLSHRELSRLMSTYLLALPEAVDPATGRLHTTFNQTVAATGRLSSSEPNLQSIPVRTALGAQIRRCFAAGPGNLLVVADYSQIDLRVMAHLSEEPTLLEAFRRGEDIHSRTAAEVFGLPPEGVDATHRRYAKAVNFGIMYGMSAFGLSQNLGIELDEAAAYIARYFERMPKVKVFIEDTIESARRRGYVATLFGRRRPIPELASSSHQQRSLGERLAVNSVIQGTAADIIKVAMIRCHERLRADYPEGKLLLQVHDELVFETPAKEAKEIERVVVEEMVAAFPMTPPLSVDSGVGPDWLAAK